jgi:trimethylamine---corrinoid protein Co-methyltransferase
MDRRARLPGALVEEAMAQAPPVVTLHNRLGEKAMALGAGPLYARTSSGATGVLDLDSGRRRGATVQDAADAARLADALPHIHGVSTMAVQPAEVPVTAVDLVALRIALTHSIKPLGYVCLNERLLEAVLAMAAAVAGGEDHLCQRPFITALAESTSPLQLVPSQLAVLRAFASRGLPLTLHSHAMAGFTAPVSLAGELVVSHAEILVLATLAQLIRPGTPLVYGLSSSVPDMRSGTNRSGATEIGLLGGAGGRLARRCGLPCVMSAGTDAHAPGAQSVLERLVTLLPPALAGVDLVNLSTLDTKMTFSLEQLVVDDALLRVVGRLLQGIRVDDDTLALELIDELGPGGNYAAERHTVRHLRQELSDGGLLTSGLAPAQVRDEVRRVLAEHQVPSLAAGVVRQLDDIMREAGALISQGEMFR